MLERVVIVGASLAGLRAAQTLRREGFAGSLAVVGEEQHLPYRRPPLSKEFLAGAAERDSVPLGGHEEAEADWLLGRRATGLDLARGEVALEDGERLGFDGLVIATGASPRRLRGTPELDGVHVVRTIDDALGLREELRRGRPRVLVVGCGFIGSEIASTCRTLGLHVTVVDPLPLPLAPLGPLVGGVCAELQREHGVDLRLGCAVVEVEGHGSVERVRLSDGSTVDADLLVVGVGVTPATGWLEDSGLLLDDGVVCDETLAAHGRERIVAAGDVARWRHTLFDGRLVRVEHWSNAVEQGVAAAKRLLADPERAEPFVSLPSFWSDQFGVRIQSFGLPQLGDDAVLVEGSIEARQFLVVYTERGRAIGAVALNLPRALIAARDLLLQRGRIDELGQRAEASPAAV
jgi:3-phenylpropionate/trans-cinnamate dioxygenase ferredoxin reductase subunit